VHPDEFQTVRVFCTLRVQLLANIRSLFHRLSSETMVQGLADHDDSPWPEGMSLTKAQLARTLAPFGIRPTIVQRTRTQVKPRLSREGFPGRVSAVLVAITRIKMMMCGETTKMAISLIQKRTRRRHCSLESPLFFEFN
jgi:hypothetical protein